MRISRAALASVSILTIAYFSASAFGTADAEAAAGAPRPASGTTAAGVPAHAVRQGGVRKTAIAGYVWSGNPTASGPPDPDYSYNSAGRGVAISHTGRGTYTVRFAGLGGAALGTVDVTDEEFAGTCHVARWGSSRSAGVAYVACLSPAGVPADSTFDLAMTMPVRAPAGVMDFAWVFNPVMSSRLTGAHQYNSAGKVNSVRHLGTGRYQLTLPGPASAGVRGTAAVTAFGPAAGDCAVAGWHGTTRGEVVDVDCFSPAGSPQNREFVVTYVRGTGIIGQNGLRFANVYANQPTAAHYRPVTQDGSTSAVGVTVTRLGQGSYELILANAGTMVNAGDPQVSTAGNADRHCFVPLWDRGLTPVVFVECVTNHNAFADTPFTLQLVTS
jgi:hypothetical protein